MSEIKFRNIAAIIELRITEGQYPAGSKLPPHRELAQELNTTPATIAKAYKLLAEKNRVESFVGRGTYVCGESNLSQAIHPPENETEYNFSILQPCLHQNTVQLQTAFQQAATQLTPALTGYVEHSGHEQHRHAGVTWARQYGLAGGTPHNTLLTNGAQHALSLLITAFTKPGDTIAVESLTYPGILAIASLQGRHVVGVALDDDGMCPHSLREVLGQYHPKLVIVIPSHQNPTGITMPAQRRQAIATVIATSSAWLVEDDIYGFLNPEPLPSICNWLPEQGFHISSLSKAISPALRCGYVKVPDSQVVTVNAQIRANIWLSSPFNHTVASQMIESGQAFDIADAQRATALRRQALARSVLTGSAVDLSEQKHNGFQIWLPLPAHWQQERFVMEAKHRGLIVSSGSYFQADHATPGNHVRLSLMSVSTEARLQEGLSQLNDLLHSDMNTVFPF
ncbi:PLP-dependent aminotransferase family protein [Photobacterium sp. TY1-4]|uniref:aminotransferase-like domain-containing protein n=1 Tax=Photobacterium sp. TY1-4 TaxID=2899122 RepID=UPI0021BED258|nr:PLP-dependent aminotransferase family protein [Photobacterium sp. TY1-4]UXI03241.1 PLP-dependent aminotransferase family protein [Photobacterium sp. TY1-4]